MESFTTPTRETPSPIRDLPTILFGTPEERVLDVRRRIPKKDITAFDYRLEYQKLQSKANQEGVEEVLDVASLFPLEGVYGGMPLLVWNKMREQKFIIVAGYGREYEGKMVKEAKAGRYKRTKTIDCRSALKDPPVGSIEDNARILMSLADEIGGYWMDANTENIVVYCFAGQNRSMAATLLFLMLRVYNKNPGETSKTFARRMLTLLSGSRPSAFVSIKDVKWLGEKKTRYPFSWFELVMYVYGMKKGVDSREEDLIVF